MKCQEKNDNNNDSSIIAFSNGHTDFCNNNKYTRRYENNCDDNYGVIDDRSDAGNPPSLPPERLPYIHSIIPNDGERILLFSLVY